VKGSHAHDIAAIFDRAGVAVRTGAHCAMPLLKCFSLLATCRVSLGLYNAREEIDVPVRALIRPWQLLA